MSVMEQTTQSPSPFATFDAMSLAPVDDVPQLTVSPSQTTLQCDSGDDDIDGDDENSPCPDMGPAITVDPPKDDEESTPKPEEKKPVKKRKSWGQELPVPKTNLPPRKRAKTEDEKEQRRIERVLRNRAAAQTSRERKRLEVEKLEGEKEAIAQQNEFLLGRLKQMEAENSRLNQQVAKLSSEISQSSSRGTTPQSVHSPESESPTLAPVLFKQEGDEVALDKIPFSSPSASNSLFPPSMDAPDLTKDSDLTQHPAAVLCDLQCQSEDSTVPKTSSSTSPMFTLALQAITQHLWLTTISAAYSTLILPLSQVFHSLKTGCPLTSSLHQSHPDQIFPLILWLISTPSLSTSTSSQASTSTRVSSRRSIFRIRLLTRLLECSPALARPLRDATSRALQLVAREGSLSGSLSSTAHDRAGFVQDWALLMTTIWAIDMVERRSTTSRPAGKRRPAHRIQKGSQRNYDRQGLKAKRMCLRRMRSSSSREADS